MESAEATTSINSKSEPIAPWWHTLIAIGSIASWYERGLPNAHLPGVSYRLSSYITVLVEECFVVLLIWLALRHRASWNAGDGLQDAIGGVIAFLSRSA
jgi:hypothetical protein